MKKLADLIAFAALKPLSQAEAQTGNACSTLHEAHGIKGADCAKVSLKSLRQAGL